MRMQPSTLSSFSLMSGGVTDWRPMLDIASEWLARTGITTSDNPKLMMINMNEASRLALKATMWCDIMSTLTLKTTPKHPILLPATVPRRIGLLGFNAAGHRRVSPSYG
ncbi:uncharacterized protein F5891DRAFT_689620 [Suillus fuscotomentosus]|uniref:Uncharacterized protein n=1 Tax=Suillus fuscotomentosus TaxID=1912939 RepID=A0AAD4EFQ1_9AGAM|nr:uncharacterized protein F5891DRAFT_689620 [Suillus fuscotomentosus]KAG1905425.1 hypothetical protein F5891DRAFT_689620 [Suillus fuscotomentosus]